MSSAQISSLMANARRFQLKRKEHGFVPEKFVTFPKPSRKVDRWTASDDPAKAEFRYVPELPETIILAVTVIAVAVLVSVTVAVSSVVAIVVAAVPASMKVMTAML